MTKKNIRRAAASVVSALLITALITGCGGNAVTPRGDDVFSQAFAKYAPDEVIATVGDLDVTWEVYFYFLSFVLEKSVYYNGIDNVYADGEESGAAIRENILSETRQYIIEYYAVELLAESMGVTLSERYQKELDDLFAEDLAACGGDSTRLENSLWTNSHLTKSAYEWTLMIPYLYKDIVATQYGPEPEIETASDTEITEYIRENNNLWRVKQILLNGTGDDKLAQAETIITLLDMYEGDDFDSYFDSMVTLYSADASKSYYPNGYTFTDGVMVEEITAEAASLSVGEYSAQPVLSDYGYHIIYRLPIDLDEEVIFPDGDTKNGETVRQYISYLINGEEYDEYQAESSAFQDVFDEYFETLSFVPSRILEKLDLVKLFPKSDLSEVLQ